jgi:hypothetical protein
MAFKRSGVRLPLAPPIKPSEIQHFFLTAQLFFRLGARQAPDTVTRMGLGNVLKTFFGAANATPSEAPRLSATSESALASSLQRLLAAERGWITLAEAARLFSAAEPAYAFGEMDDAGKLRLEQFSAEHRCSPQFMPVEGRVYFTRNA